MRKIPTLFERVFEGHRIVKTLPVVTPGFEWVLDGEGIATVKWDGACCAVINGEMYRRYDAKNGKRPPDGAIPCCDPDPVTGHWPHWVKCSKDNPGDKWFLALYREDLPDGTYEAIGEHFNGNPYKMSIDCLIPHGKDVMQAWRTFDGIRDYLRKNAIEGIVFWRDGQPQCKIKRSDFGFRWPVKEKEANK